MANNENEGHGGYQIVPVGLTGKPDYLLRPNVVLFMAGTNDIVFDVDLANAPTRLGAVVDGIVTECPDAAILVGSLTPLLNPGWMSKIHDFNAAVPGVLSKLANGGKQVALVDMSRVNSSHIHTSDGIHPTDEAYALIAAAWYEGMVEAGKRGWIQKPVPLPGASQSPPSATSSPEGKSNSDGAREGNQDSKLFNDLPIKSTCTLNQILVSCAVLLGLIVFARKMIAVFLRRYRV